MAKLCKVQVLCGSRSRGALRLRKMQAGSPTDLHGSRARGDAHPDSDWDLAVFVKGRPTARDRSVLSHISYDLMMETGEHVQALPFPAKHERLDHSFYRNVRADGVVV